jgi:hypothetical protein
MFKVTKKEFFNDPKNRGINFSKFSRCFFALMCTLLILQLIFYAFAKPIMVLLIAKGKYKDDAGYIGHM